MYTKLLFLLAACLFPVGAHSAAKHKTVAQPVLSYEEGKPENFKGIALRTVVLKGEGFKSNSTVSITLSKLNGAKENLIKRKIDKNGRFPNTNFVLNEYFRGEPITICIESLDKKQKASLKIVPYPIEAKDAQGHKITLELMNPEATLFYFKGEGFKPFELIHLRSLSGNEELKFDFQINKEGTAAGMISPAVIGKEGGTALLEVIGKSTNLKIEYLWGDPSKRERAIAGPTP